MAQDLKYGSIDVPGIPDDEPIIIFRAQDKTAPNVIVSAVKLAVMVGSDVDHVISLLAARSAIETWQDRNALKVKTPDS